MNTPQHLIALLDTLLFRPILSAPGASLANKQRARMSRMCLLQLPFPSMLRYCQHAAEREHINDELEQAPQQLPSFRLLLPTLQAQFGDLWPTTEPNSNATGSA